MTTPSDLGIRRVGVVGAGTIGASWAALFLARGLEVVVTDPVPAAADTVRKMVETVWPTVMTLGGLPNAKPDNWRFEPDPAKAVEGVDFVQESGPEKLELKKDLFKRLDAVLPQKVVIASSSSGLLASQFSELCRFPDRCIVGHPFNPPHLVPLVEIVGGAKASRTAIETAIAFYRAIGKQPIELRKEMKGHIANRLSAALWREALYLVQEDVASVADIDVAVAAGPGLRWALMGPHLTYHLGGGAGGIAHFIEHLLPAFQTWWDDLGEPKMTEELTKKLMDGVMAEAGNNSLADWQKRRDVLLTQLIANIQTYDKANMK